MTDTPGTPTIKVVPSSCPVVFTACNLYSLSKTCHDKWASPPLHTYSTISADLVDNEESTDNATTSFYSSFLCSLHATDRFGKDPLEKYSIRDTVPFEGQALVLLSPCGRSLLHL
jgi:hypothetical protein